MSIKKYLLVFFGTLVTAATVTFLVALASARSQQKKAKQCLQEALVLPLGKATFEDAEHWSTQFGGTTSNLVGNSCTPKFCDFLVTFQNTSLARFHLAPYTAMSVGLVVSEGLIVNRGVLFKSGELPLYSVTEGTRSAEAHDYDTTIFRNVADKPEKILVRLTNGASQSDRFHAFAVPIECFSELGACSAPLPGAPSSTN